MVSQSAHIIANSTGIILAAGLGSRLAFDGVKYLKPVLALAGRPLIHRAIDSMVIAGCKKIVIVIGHQANEIRQCVLSKPTNGIELVLEVNPDYRLANGVSLHAARHHVNNRFILMMADHVVDRSMMELAGSHEPDGYGATLLVDKKIDSIFNLDDATKVQAENGRVVAIGKSISSYNCVDTGVFVCSPKIFDVLSAIVTDRGDASITDVVAELANFGSMNALDIGDSHWQDVDDSAMFAAAEKAINDGVIKPI